MSAPLSLQIFIGFFMFALVFMPLEHRFPQKSGGTFRASWMMDVTYCVVGCFVGRVTDALSVGGMLLIRHAAGWKSAQLAASQPGWLQFFEILLLADFLDYLFHRALHRNPYLWQLHKIHHSSERMDWLANVRLHPLDKILGDCFQFTPIFLLGFGDGPMLAYTIFLGFQGFLNHSNVRLDYGPLRWVIASPQFHHWHHCNHPQAYDKNFSPHLVIFDLLFGTANIAPRRVLPDVYGVPETVPQGFPGQMVFPFRGAKKDVLD